MRRFTALGLAAALFAAAPDLHADGAAPKLEEDAVIRWGKATPGIDSYSGISVSADGGSFIAVSDKGRFAKGRLLRSDGRLTGLEIEQSGPLRDPLGAEVSGWEIDAEGITLGADGRIYVSFEGKDRIDAFDNIAGKADPLPRAAAFRELQNNSGLEALFTGPDGALYTAPERSGKLDRPYPVFRFADDAWTQPYSIPRRPPHLLVGADLGPDGRLYMLERHFAGLLGFSSRIRRFRITDAGLDQEEVLLESRTGRYDNLEGISAWADPQGRVRLTLISDDNGNFFQRAEIVEFVLTPGSLPSPARGD